MATSKTKPSAATKTAPKVPPFPISAASPFPDKYDIEAERVALKDLVDMEPYVTRYRVGM